MVGIQLSCLAILALNIGVGLYFAPRRDVYLWRFFALAAASWIAEDTCIRLYGFYAYDPQWWWFIDQMPLLIALIWPSVILSAWEVAWSLSRHEDRKTPLLAGLFVLADASLIEPISVQAGLWRWFEPGLFNVPPIGIIGWAVFATFCLLIFDRSDRLRKPFWSDLHVLWLAPLGVHLSLIALWWGALRWVNHTIPPWPVIGLAWAVAFGLALWAWRDGARHRILPHAINARIIPATFFFGLLAAYSSGARPLVFYALAFAPPYLALTSWVALKKLFQRRLRQQEQRSAA